MSEYHTTALPVSGLRGDGVRICNGCSSGMIWNLGAFTCPNCDYDSLPNEEGPVAQFESGATRNLDTYKLDYEGFLSPLVLERYAEYMHEHRRQKDGTLRASDNWQKGIPVERYMKSLWRHFFDAWKIYRGGIAVDPDSDKKTVTLEAALCGVLFNAMGILHETLKGKK